MCPLLALTHHRIFCRPFVALPRERDSAFFPGAETTRPLSQDARELSFLLSSLPMGVAPRAIPAAAKDATGEIIDDNRPSMRSNLKRREVTNDRILGSFGVSRDARIDHSDDRSDRH